MWFNSTDFNSNLEIRRHSVERPWTYAQLDARQREIALLIQTQGASRHWLVSEVSSVITLGRRADPLRELTLNPSQLQSQGVDVVSTDRGGLATYHGPGQWVVFCVDSLERWTGDARGVKTVVGDLLNLGLRWVTALGRVDAHVRDEPWTGVWTSRGKIASVGIAIHDGVVLHGLAMNVFKTPKSFLGLRPCGMDVPQLDYVESTHTPSESMARALDVLVPMLRDVGRV